MRFDISGLGNALMDILVRLDSEQTLDDLDLRKGTLHLLDEYGWQQIFQAVKDFPRETHSGGDCANVVGTAAQLGAKVAFCGQVGQDHFGKHYAEIVVENHIENFLHLDADGHTGKCLSLISPDAERTMLVSLGCAIELAPDRLFLDVIAQSKIFHCSAYLFTGGRMGETARMALEHARAHNVQISFDVSDAWVIETHRELLWEVIDRYADIVFSNASEAKALLGLEPEAAAQKLAQHCRVAVVKRGAQGSVICSGEHTYGIGIHPVTAVDTTGAGDAYAGAFLYGMIHGLDLEHCGRLASRVAAETVAQTGAVVTTPGLLKGLIEGI